MITVESGANVSFVEQRILSFVQTHVQEHLNALPNETFVGYKEALINRKLEKPASVDYGMKYVSLYKGNRDSKTFFSNCRNIFTLQQVYRKKAIFIKSSYIFLVSKYNTARTLVIILNPDTGQRFSQRVASIFRKKKEQWLRP